MAGQTDRVDGAVRQSAVGGRRVVFAALVVATMTVLLVLMVRALSGQGFGISDFVLLVCFGITLPWTAIGFWNAVFGLTVMRGSRDPVLQVAPFAGKVDESAPIAARVALLSCIRNEDPDSLVRGLDAMLHELEAEGAASLFHLYILSDTSDPQIALAEQAAAERLGRAHDGAIGVTYRLRSVNTGFKAGNVRDFCERWGDRHDIALILDADSLMGADAMLRAVRILEQNPEIGILQTLVTGTPTTSAFARLFQFGMRLGMRSWTLGSAWWQGDCGPYWGHNAVIRLAPFIAHCHLPVLPGKPPLGGVILSHDQVEAVLMRRAGYEVRVLPEERASFEQNPPTLLEFIRRDLRWCQGNMQYWRLLALPGLRLTSRVQLGLAILMYLGGPAWMGFVGFSILRSLVPGLTPVHYDTTVTPYLVSILLFMIFAPKIATAIDVLASPSLRRAFGGGLGFVRNFVLEMIFSALLSPVVAVTQTVFVAGLPFGATIGWTGQKREDHAVSFAAAARRLWLPTLLGIGMTAAAVHGGYLWVALPVSIGLMGAIPFAMLTASPAVGRRAQSVGICRIPEEIAPPAILIDAGLPALIGRRAAAALAALVPFALLFLAPLDAPRAGERVLFENATKPTRCAETDNVYVKAIGSGITRFAVEVRHPGYLGTVTKDDWTPDFTDCDMSNDPSFPFAFKTVILFEDDRHRLVGHTFGAFWRPESVGVRVGDAFTDALHLVQLIKKVPPDGQFPARELEILVVYPSDGYWRAKPLPPAGWPDTAYGSSFLVGPIEEHGRPFVPIREIEFVPAELAFRLAFRTGPGVLRVEEASPARTRLAVTLPPVAGESAVGALRSMYVSDKVADMTEVALPSAGGAGFGSAQNILAFERAAADRILFLRSRPSTHNTSAPDLLFADFSR